MVDRLLILVFEASSMNLGSLCYYYPYRSIRICYCLVFQVFYNNFLDKSVNSSTEFWSKTCLKFELFFIFWGMKVLGVHFSIEPDVSAQVAAICKKFRPRVWTLHPLYHNGFTQEELLQVYKSTILP